MDWQKALVWLVMFALALVMWVGVYYVSLFCYHVLIWIGG